MATPSEIINKKYGDVFVSKSKILKLVSSGNPDFKSGVSSVFNARLDTASLNPVVVTILVPGEIQVQTAAIRDLNWSSLHIRSYANSEYMAKAGIVLNEKEKPQRATVGATKNSDNMSIRAVGGSDNSKIYAFDDADAGKLTVFTNKPAIPNSGNDLPRLSTFLAMLGESNFVYEK